MSLVYIYLFILYIFSVTGQSCHLPNHLILLSPKGSTYYVMYGYHSLCASF